MRAPRRKALASSSSSFGRARRRWGAGPAARAPAIRAPGEGACDANGICPFHPFLIAAQERFLDTLRTTSLADVIQHGLSLPVANQTATRA